MAIPNGSSKPTFEARLYRFGKLSDLVRSKPRVFTVEEREVARHEIQSYLRSQQSGKSCEDRSIMTASSMPRQSRHQTEMLNEGIEIAVAVEQGVTIFDATRRNQRVDRLPDRHSARTQMAEIAGGLQRHIQTHQWNNWQRGEQCFRLIEIVFADKPLQYFGEDQIADQQQLAGEQLIETITLRRQVTTK